MKLLYRTLGIVVLVVTAICTAHAQTTPSVITMHDAATATGNGTALVVSVNSAAAGANLGAVGIQITGTFSATITFEATTDGTNWTAVMATELADDSRATTATAAGHYTVIFGSAIRIRARISSYSSGSVTVKARLIPGLTARLTSGGGGGGSGTVTSVAFTGGLISVADPTTAAALTVAGTSGGIPYFSSTSTWASSAALAANALVIGGGAGVAPATTTTGTGVLTALGVNVGSAGAFVTFNGALGTPSSGVGTNLTGTAAGLTAGTATALQTARTIGGVSFDGTANITVASATGGFEVTTGITTPSTTFALVNATATTINFAGAATTLNIGTSATVLNFGGGATAGEFRFLEPSGSGTNYSAFKAVAQAANITYSLPPTVGAAGTVLTDAAGDGVLSWAAGGSGITIGTTTITSGTSTKVLFNNAGVVGEYTVTGTGNAVLSASPTLTGTVAMAAQTNTGTIVQTSASATAFVSGPNGATNPVLTVVNNVASQATGLSITGNAAGGGVSLAPTSSQANDYLKLTGKGSVGVTVPLGSASAPLFTGDGSTAGPYWAAGGMGVSTGSAGRGWFGSTGVQLASGSGLLWSSTSTPEGTPDAGFARLAAAVIRTSNGSTGAGSLVLGTSTVGSIGTSGVSVFAIANGTAPTSSPADEFQLYSADAAAGAAEAWIRNEAGEITPVSGLGSRNSSSFAKTTDTTLANITGLTRNVAASRTYAFRAVVQTTAAVTGGVKFAVSGTATATAISYEGTLISGAALVAQTRATALDTVVCASTTTTAGTCVVEGVISVSSAGTLTLQFAQNSSDAGASTVLANQYMQLIPIG